MKIILTLAQITGILTWIYLWFKLGYWLFYNSLR